MSPPKVTLPAACAECVFFRAGEKGWGTCFRHAPAPGTDEFEIVYWPAVKPSQRCGAGAKMAGSGSGLGVMPCVRCVHWWQPEGQPVTPAYRSGLSREWWEGSGYCTRHAPGPSTEAGRQTYWRITHALQACGDALDASALAL